MILLPYGHDQSVYGRPWATWALIAINVAAFVLVTVASFGAEDELERRIADLYAVRAEHPGARVDPYVLRDAPAGVQGALADIVQQDATAPITAADEELEDATRELVGAVRELPTHRFGYRPAEPSLLGVVSSPFMHASWMHLLGNMLFLWLAGAVIECFWDRGPFLAAYGLAALAALAAHHLAMPDDPTPVVGASGAVAGMLGAFVVGYPKTRVRLLWAVYPLGVGHLYMPAWALIGLWALLQLVFGALDEGGGVAHWAHVGGFVFGVAAALVMRKLGWVIEDAGDGRDLAGRLGGDE